MCCSHQATCSCVFWVDLSNIHVEMKGFVRLGRKALSIVRLVSLCRSIVMLHKNVEDAFVNFFVQCCFFFFCDIVEYGEDHCFIEGVLDYYCSRVGVKSLH